MLANLLLSKQQLGADGALCGEELQNAQPVRDFCCVLSSSHVLALSSAVAAVLQRLQSRGLK